MASEDSEACRTELTAKWKELKAIEDPFHDAFIVDHSNEGCAATWTVWVSHELSEQHVDVSCVDSDDANRCVRCASKIGSMSAGE